MNIEEHYKTLAPKLTNWLVATGSSYAEACDLVQNTFLKLWKMRDDLRDDDAEIVLSHDSGYTYGGIRQELIEEEYDDEEEEE